MGFFVGFFIKVIFEIEVLGGNMLISRNNNLSIVNLFFKGKSKYL